MARGPSTEASWECRSRSKSRLAVKVTVVCFGSLRDCLPDDAVGNRSDLEVSEGATPLTVAEALGATGRSLFAVLINGEQRPIDSALDEGDEITLMPPFAGGQRRLTRSP